MQTLIKKICKKNVKDFLQLRSPPSGYTQVWPPRDAFRSVAVGVLERKSFRSTNVDPMSKWGTWEVQIVS